MGKYTVTILIGIFFGLHYGAAVEWALSGKVLAGVMLFNMTLIAQVLSLMLLDQAENE